MKLEDQDNESEDDGVTAAIFTFVVFVILTGCTIGACILSNRLERGIQMATKKAKKEKVYATRIRLDRQGYSPEGRYFGVGAPVYFVHDDNYNHTSYVRAQSSAEAKKKAGF
jgi:hypothetical protein